PEQPVGGVPGGADDRAARRAGGGAPDRGAAGIPEEGRAHGGGAAGAPRLAGGGAGGGGGPGGGGGGGGGAGAPARRGGGRAGRMVLLVSHWVLGRHEAKQWVGFLQRRVMAMAPGQSGWPLFALSFVAAYREAFEVVLFYRALLLDVGPERGAVAAGAATGVV